MSLTNGLRAVRGFSIARLPILSVFGALAVVLIILAVQFLRVSEEPSALAQIISQEEQALAKLNEGGTLYFRDEVFVRHGPAADALRERTDEWYLPERYIHEVWVVAEPGGKISRIYGAVKDIDGKTYQEIETVDGQVQTRDVASGAMTRNPLLGQASEAAQKLADSIRTISSDESWVETVSDKTIRLEKPIPVPERAGEAVPEGGTVSESIGYSLPFAEDLDAASALRRIEVRRDNPVPVRWTTVLIDRSGREIIVEDKTRTAFEVIDSSR